MPKQAVWTLHPVAGLTASSRLRSPGPVGPHVASPKFYTHTLWKGQRSQLQLRHREVWHVLMDVSGKTGNDLPSLKLGAKWGTTP